MINAACSGFSVILIGFSALTKLCHYVPSLSPEVTNWDEHAGSSAANEANLFGTRLLQTGIFHPASSIQSLLHNRSSSMMMALDMHGRLEPGLNMHWLQVGMYGLVTFRAPRTDTSTKDGCRRPLGPRRPADGH